MSACPRLEIDDPHDVASALDLALVALKSMDARCLDEPNKETGWRSDELCAAYVLLHEMFERSDRAAAEDFARAIGSAS